MLNVAFPTNIANLAVAIVEVDGAKLGPANAGLLEYAQAAARMAAETGMAGGEERRNAVRELLRSGGFKPAGRGKPAQEYLLRTATENGALPSIVNGVDLINAVSLNAGLPISLLSLERLGADLSLRYGQLGERYVFNRAGQELDLAGLICLCAGHGASSRPAGTPVKDSLAAKVEDGDQRLVACIYASTIAIACKELSHWANELAQGFNHWCGARSADVRLFPASW